jgi:hypothetical protein
LTSAWPFWAETVSLFPLAILICRICSLISTVLLPSLSRNSLSFYFIAASIFPSCLLFFAFYDFLPADSNKFFSLAFSVALGACSIRLIFMFYWILVVELYQVWNLVLISGV